MPRRRKSQHGGAYTALRKQPGIPPGYVPGAPVQSGQGWLGDAWNWTKGAARWVKDRKIISNAAKVAGVLGVPGASAVGTAAGAVGLGRGRRAPRGARTGVHGVTQW